MTQGVVKNIIPAIASTNAIVAASCCNEAFKIATGSNPNLGYPGTNNYMMYSGDDGVYTYTFEHEKKPDCPVCGNLAREIDVRREWRLQDFVDHLAERPEAYVQRPQTRALDTDSRKSNQETTYSYRGQDALLLCASQSRGANQTQPQEEAGRVSGRWRRSGGQRSSICYRLQIQSAVSLDASSNACPVGFCKMHSAARGTGENGNNYIAPIRPAGLAVGTNSRSSCFSKYNDLLHLRLTTM